MDIDRKEVNLIVEWFGVVQDLNPKFLEKKDYLLAKKCYEYVGYRVPNSILEKLQP